MNNNGTTAVWTLVTIMIIASVIYGACSWFKASPQPPKDMSDRVSVYEDEEHGVSCYILDEKALSCLPNQFLTKPKNE